jgi:hypothetical protein
LIIEAFCGEGYSMTEALKLAGVEAHPDGTAYRVREALDDLVQVMAASSALFDQELVPAKVA